MWLLSVQHCASKSHRELVADPSFYRSLDELIDNGLQLTTDKFHCTDLHSRDRHDILTAAFFFV